MHINAKATLITDNDYYCHVIAIELVKQTVWGPHHATSCHWLLIALGVDTHTHTNTHINTHTRTDDLHRINFYKPGTCQPVAGTCLV